VFVGRVRSYQEWLGVVTKPPVVEWLEQELAAEEPILQGWDSTLPIEMAAIAQLKDAASGEPDVSGEKEPDSGIQLLAALSIPLKSFDPQLYQRLGYARHAAGSWSKSDCLVAAATGPAKARLICSDTLEAATRLQAYLSRGLPSEALSPDPIFFEFRPEPFKALWGPARAELEAELAGLSSMPGLTAQVAEQLAMALLEEASAWAASLQSVRFEGGLDDAGQLRTTASLRFNAPEPWLVESYLATASHVQGPPASFMNLPADMDSAGYDYGLPPARVALIQRALVRLGQAALAEFGPLSGVLQSASKAERKVIDNAVSRLLLDLDSPCLRAPHLTWAMSNAGSRSLAPNAPIDEMLRRLHGYLLYSTPTDAQCPALLASLVEAAYAGYGLLPESTRRSLSVRIDKGYTLRTAGLPPLTVRKVTLPKTLLDELVTTDARTTDTSTTDTSTTDTSTTDTSTTDAKANDTSAQRWSRAKGPVTYTIITLRGTTDGADDWFALGFDEKELIRALRAVTAPSGATLGERPDIAPLKQTKTIQYINRTYGYLALGDLLPQQDPLRTLQQRFLDMRTTSTLQATPLKTGGSELSLSYALSKDSMDSLRQMLSWEKERWQELLSQVTADPELPQGPIGIVREVTSAPATPGP
jgi:hypothetical protein